MIAAKITLKNYDELLEAFKRAPLRMLNNTHTAVQQSILQVERNVKREAPVNKQAGGGNLRQSISSYMRGTASGIVEAGVAYAGYVEFGTRPHIIRVRKARVLAGRASVYGNAFQFFGREVHHPGTRPNPFFGRGLKNSENQINDFFVAAVKKLFS